ncbi:MAG: hypothetical protein LBF16_07035 [Pseudomonadales bacterium]|jgi:hypothetical protein|nr:hypothetical protein [Pseudomonadales bacterium]
MLSAGQLFAKESKLQSVYTSLSDKDCKLLDVEEGRYSLGSCPGTNGYTLHVEDFGALMSLTVVDDKKREYPLYFFKHVTLGFPSIGPKAEWRVRQSGRAWKSIALIVRVIA